ncbi:MAG: efflux RND transporter periplasmic adaptor subunit [Acidobacteria bacterium]|nr:efflux RND transporter periplasmic adaptor subunit [Acidobacteriota bacterium]
MAAGKRRFLYFLIAVFILLAAVIAVRQWQRSVMTVRTARVERRDIHTGVVTNGRAEPMQFRNVHAEGEGEVEEVFVREGEKVRRGQKLVQLSQRQIQSELEKARAELTEAENTLRLLRRGGTELELQELRAQYETARRDRGQLAKEVADNERLLEKGAIARIELEMSRNRLAKAESDLAVLDQKLNRRYDPEELGRGEARVQAARAALTLAESRLRSTAVAAPLDGIAYAVAVRPGDYIRSGDLLLRVGDLERIRVRVFVDEPDLGRIAQGQAVLITWDGLPAKQWTGQVERLASEVRDMETRKVGEIVCTLDNISGEILPNVNLNIEIVTESKLQTLTVPREAVGGMDSDRHVYLVRDGVLVRQPVETGISSLTRVEIRQGIEEGDEVVLAGEQPLQEGMRVRNSSP